MNTTELKTSNQFVSLVEDDFEDEPVQDLDELGPLVGPSKPEGKKEQELTRWGDIVEDEIEKEKKKGNIDPELNDNPFKEADSCYSFNYYVASVNPNPDSVLTMKAFVEGSDKNIHLHIHKLSNDLTNWKSIPDQDFIVRNAINIAKLNFTAAEAGNFLVVMPQEYVDKRSITSGAHKLMFSSALDAALEMMGATVAVVDKRKMSKALMGKDSTIQDLTEFIKLIGSIKDITPREVVTISNLLGHLKEVNPQCETFEISWKGRTKNV